jgi:hypothetical protein
MLRRLATIATVLALVGCSDGLYLPTEVSRQLNVDDSTTVPPDLCVDYIFDEESFGIPCVDIRPWPVDGVAESRAKHGYEAVTTGGGSRKGIRF